MPGLNDVFLRIVRVGPLESPLKGGGHVVDLARHLYPPLAR
jgi:hypothetical protein